MAAATQEKNQQHPDASHRGSLAKNHAGTVKPSDWSRKVERASRSSSHLGRIMARGRRSVGAKDGKAHAKMRRTVGHDGACPFIHAPGPFKTRTAALPEPRHR